MQRVAGDRELPEALREQICARTDGMPLSIEELTKAVIEAGMDNAAISDALWPVVGGFTGGSELPDVIEARALLASIA